MFSVGKAARPVTLVSAPHHRPLDDDDDDDLSPRPLATRLRGHVHVIPITMHPKTSYQTYRIRLSGEFTEPKQPDITVRPIHLMERPASADSSSSRSSQSPVLSARSMVDPSSSSFSSGSQESADGDHQLFVGISDTSSMPEIPPLALNLTKLLATLPDSPPQSLSPFTFTEEVTKLNEADFQQFLDEDSLWIKSVIFGQRFAHDSIAEFVGILTQDQFAFVIESFLRQYFTLANLLHMFRDSLAVASVPALALKIE
jgi:hypothetical protein